MNAILIIAARELRERKRLFAFAAGMALIPFAVAMLPSMSGNRQTAIATTGGGFGAVFVLGLSLALGITIITRDLADRRLSFYFAKPIGSAALWIGKVAASLVLIVTGGIMAIVPSVLASGKTWSAVWSTGGWPLAALAASSALALFFGGHAVATMVRSRSILVGVDFALAVVAGAVAFVLLRPLLIAHSFELLAGFGAAMLAGILTAAAIAPVWQLSRGRTDAVRSHFAFSQAFWSGVTIVLVAGAAYTLWITSIAPADLTRVQYVEQAASGSHAFVAGLDSSRGEFPGLFLIDAASGASDRLSIPPWWEIKFSRDGSVLAWMAPEQLMQIRELRLSVRRLDRAGAETIETPLRYSTDAAFTLSDDGSRVAVRDNTTVSVHELPSGRTLAAVAGLDARSMAFIGRDRVRVIAGPRGRTGTDALTIHDIDVPRRRVTRSGGLTVSSNYMGVSMSADGTRMLVRHGATVMDAQTGRTIARLPLENVRAYSAAVLRDGRVVAAHEGQFHLFDRDGNPLRQVPILPGKYFVLGQVGDSKVLLSSQSGVTVVDLERGVVAYRLPNVKAPGVPWSFDPRLQWFDADARLTGVEGESRIVTWDAAVGPASLQPLAAR